jgi:GT2 family glycosyltransferase
MSARLRRAGFRIGYAPAVAVYHEVDPSRASRERFIRIARERGYCRTLHEHHSRFGSQANLALAWARLALVRIAGAPLARIVREERRTAVARGILDGLREQRP